MGWWDELLKWFEEQIFNFVTNIQDFFQDWLYYWDAWTKWFNDVYQKNITDAYTYFQELYGTLGDVNEILSGWLNRGWLSVTLFGERVAQLADDNFDKLIAVSEYSVEQIQKFSVDVVGDVVAGITWLSTSASETANALFEEMTKSITWLSKEVSDVAFAVGKEMEKNWDILTHSWQNVLDAIPDLTDIQNAISSLQDWKSELDKVTSILYLTWIEFWKNIFDGLKKSAEDTLAFVEWIWENITSKIIALVESMVEGWIDDFASGMQKVFEEK